VISSGFGSTVSLNGCIIDVIVDNPNANLLLCDTSGMITVDGIQSGPGRLVLNGRGHTVGTIISVGNTSNFIGTYDPQGATFQINDIICASTTQNAANLSVIDWSVLRISGTGATGSKYSASANSIIQMRGQTPPGTTAGGVGTGAQYIP
jgi:hypothetical protein